MNKFIRTLFWFVAPMMVFAIFAALMGVCEWKCILAAISSNVTRIGAIGNSHCQYAIADKEFTNITNFGLRATPTAFWLAKARLALPLNPQMDVMLVDIYPDVLFETCDEIVRLRFMRNFHPQTLMMDFACRQDIKPFDTFRLLNRCWSGIVMPFLGRVFTKSNYCRLHERWFAVDQYVKDKDPSEFPTDLIQNGKIPLFPTQGWKDIDKLCALLRENGVKPILITAPLPKMYRNRLTSDQWKVFENWAKGLAEKHKTVWKDYSCAFDDEENYCDHFHLNKSGAQRFTKMLLDEYDKGRF